jgi:ATP-dependent DNA ligase
LTIFIQHDFIVFSCSAGTTLIGKFIRVVSSWARRFAQRAQASRPHLGALLLGYNADDGKLIYAGRVGTGMPVKVLTDLRRRLEPLARKTSPLNVLPPRKTRFGSPLVLSRVHWAEPKLVAEITYLTWTADGLLRHTVYVGRREDKPAKADQPPSVRSRRRETVIASVI